MAYYSNSYKIAEGGKITRTALEIAVETFTAGWNGNSTTLADMSDTTYTWTVPAGIQSFTAYIWGGGASGTESGVATGGYSKATFACQPGWKYKIIPARGAENSNNNGTDSYSEGGYGIGGGAAQDGNDRGSGGAGSGLFYCGIGSVAETSAATIYSRGVLIAGGGGCGQSSYPGGAGNGGSTSSVTVYGVTGLGIDGGNGAGDASSSGGGGKADGRGGEFYSIIGSTGGGSSGNAAFGTGGSVLADGYDNSAAYGGGGGGGAGAGGGGGWANGGTPVNGENATGWGGRGSDNYDRSLNGNAGPGMGGDFNSTGGNGFIWQPANCYLGGGGGGGHGCSSAGGGFGGGASQYYAYGGGGGSGCAFGYIDTPILSTWVNPNTVQLDLFGSEIASSYIGTSPGTARVSSSSGSASNGAVIIVY